MEHEEANLKLHFAFTAGVGAFLLLNVLGLFRTVWGWDTALFLTLLGGHRIFVEAIRRAFRRETSADLAVAIAAAAALWIRQYTAAAEVILIMLIGEGLELYAVDRTRGALRKLLDLSPQQARVRRDGTEQVVPIAEVGVGDTVVARPGDRIPVDGVVVKGRSSVDQASITGESMPVTKEAGNEVFAGTINGPGLLEVRAEAVGENTKLAEIVHLVEEAEESRAPVQRRVDRYARFFVPAVIALAILTFLIVRKTGEPGAAHILRAVAVLIVACPCALVLATPTAVVAALGRLARSGILVKGGAYLEAAGEVDCVVFDKTGTLTSGRPEIAAVKAFGGASEEDVLSLAAAAEQGSGHPLAELIVRETRRRGLPVRSAEGFAALPGLGVEATVEGRKALVGCRRLLEQGHVQIPDLAAEALAAMDREGYTIVLVARDGRLAGAIAAEDALRKEARETVSRLKEIGIRSVWLLTGDNARVAAKIARQAGIRSYAADLLPADKVQAVKRLQSEGRKVAMLGDGVNDAPSLAAADVGIAMGGIGSDIAQETADIVFLTDDLSRLAETIDIGRRTVSTIKANIVWFALGFNLVGIGAAAWGWATPVVAAILHQVSSLLVVLNSLRLLTAGRFREMGLGRVVARAVSFFREDIPRLARQGWDRREALGWRLAGLLAFLYVGSGVYTVQPGQVGVERRFGKRVGEPTPPGVHYRLPWPMGRVDRVSVGQVRTLEIGFRTTPGIPGEKAPEPAAYEWNLRHTTGRYEKKLEEATMLTGDENLVEATLAVQYKVDDPVAYLFHAADVEGCLLGSAESAVRSVVSECSLVALLAADRRPIEALAAQRMQKALERSRLGIRIERVLLQDVHPPLEVVEDFRAVSSAFEEKHRVVNEAEAYAAQQQELAKGRAAERIETAHAYEVEKRNRAAGDASKFECVAAAYAQAPEVTARRLFLETMEASLAGVRKVIVDQRRKGKCELFLFDDKGTAAKLNELLKAQPAGALAPAAGEGGPQEQQE